MAGLAAALRISIVEGVGLALSSLLIPGLGLSSDSESSLMTLIIFTISIRGGYATARLAPFLWKGRLVPSVLHLWAAAALSLATHGVLQRCACSLFFRIAHRALSACSPNTIRATWWLAAILVSFVTLVFTVVRVLSAFPRHQ